MIFLLLTLLFVKHWFADFVVQFEYMVEQKGQYGRIGGVEHAILHGVLTTVLVAVFLDSVVPGLLLGLLDAVIHYHIDYVKARFGTKDPATQKFWIQLGADQMAHSMFYIWLVWLLNGAV